MQQLFNNLIYYFPSISMATLRWPTSHAHFRINMNDLLPILGVAAVAFLATNADNLILLFAFL